MNEKYIKQMADDMETIDIAFGDNMVTFIGGMAQISICDLALFLRHGKPQQNNTKPDQERVMELMAGALENAQATVKYLGRLPLVKVEEALAEYRKLKGGE